jgi:hypothetical protein
MYVFEEGCTYQTAYSGTTPVKVLKRTAKMCLVENDVGNTWRMKIRTIGDSETMIDTAVPRKWRDTYTYYAKYKEE